MKTFVMIPCSTSLTQDALLVPFSTPFHSGKLITVEPLYISGHLQMELLTSNFYFKLFSNLQITALHVTIFLPALFNLLLSFLLK